MTLSSQRLTTNHSTTTRQLCNNSWTLHHLNISNTPLDNCYQVSQATRTNRLPAIGHFHFFETLPSAKTLTDRVQRCVVHLHTAIEVTKALYVRYLGLDFARLQPVKQTLLPKPRKFRFRFTTTANSISPCLFVLRVKRTHTHTHTSRINQLCFLSKARSSLPAGPHATICLVSWLIQLVLYGLLQRR